MSVPDTAVSTRRKDALLVRSAVPADHAAIRAVVIAAYGQYADLIPPDIFSAYLADLLDTEAHASHGPLFVAEAENGSADTGRSTRTPRTRGSAGRPAGPAGARSPSTRPRAGTVSRALS